MEPPASPSRLLPPPNKSKPKRTRTKNPFSGRTLSHDQFNAQNIEPPPSQIPSVASGSQVTNKKSRNQNPYSLPPQFKVPPSTPAATPPNASTSILRSASSLSFNSITPDTPELMFGTPSTPASNPLSSLYPQTPCSTNFSELPIANTINLADPLHVDTSHSPLFGSLGLDAMTLDSPFIPAMDHEEDGPEKTRTRKPRRMPTREILQMLNQEYQMTVWELIQNILTMTTFDYHLVGLYRGDSRRLEQMLDALWDIGPIRERMSKWMQPVALEQVSERVHQEFSKVKSEHYFYSHQVTPEVLQTYNFRHEMQSTRKSTPAWDQIIRSVTDSIESPERYERNCLGINVVTAQVLHMHSPRCNKFQITFGVFSQAVGASRQMIETPNHCHLSTCFPTTQDTITHLADRAVEHARTVSFGPHMLDWDNYNSKGSVHVEQRPNAPSKVQSGTLVLCYGLRFVKDPSHMLLEPITTRLRNSSPVTVVDFKPSVVSLSSYRHQLAIHLIRVLVSFGSPRGFDPSYILNHPLLQFLTRHQIPALPTTSFDPLRITTIEEASTAGNLKVPRDAYIDQMKRLEETLNAMAVVSINDQLTNARIRSTQVLRHEDISPWEQRKIFQLAPAIFHMLMNLHWGIRDKHYGTIRQPGSLSNLYSRMGKKRLGNDKPEYYPLRDAHGQVLDGIVICAWKEVLPPSYPTLGAFLDSNPSPALLLGMSFKILNDFARPLPNVTPPPPPKPRKKRNTPDSESTAAATATATEAKSASGASPSTQTSSAPAPTATAPPTSQAEASTSSTAPSQTWPSTSTQTSSSKDPERDILHQNIRLLFHDLLYLRELETSTKTGDVGRIEDILPNLMAIFRGCGSAKYAMEILHYLDNLNQIWPEEFANIVRKNILVNLEGHDDSFLGVDMNIEHIINEIKKLYAAKGIYASWDRLGDYAAAIRSLIAIKKVMRSMMETAYQKKEHTNADTSASVWEVVSAIEEYQLLKFIPDRKVDVEVKATPNLLSEGWDKVRKTTIPTYNKNMALFRDSDKDGVFEVEEDELRPMDFTTGQPEDD
ncbi:hypothetical protein PM082_024759 [Marasmius tenuissimus]|nr:hypothetical protein PM082_024759 [Marasmius tenuissimus]